MGECIYLSIKIPKASRALKWTYDSQLQIAHFACMNPLHDVGNFRPQKLGSLDQILDLHLIKTMLTIWPIEDLSFMKVNYKIFGQQYTPWTFIILTNGPKLTDKRIDLPLFTVVHVNLAVQVLSHSSNLIAVGVHGTH